MNEWPLYAQQRWAGKRVQRLEDPGMLTGATTYVTDVQLPRMLELAFVRSPAAHARIISIDVDAARSVPGVHAVLGPEELAHVHSTNDFVDLEGALKTPRVTLPGDRVRYVGEPVAAVVADDRYVAEDGADAVAVALEPLDDDEPIHDGIPDGRYFSHAAAHGDIDAAYAAAEHVARRRLAIQRVVTSPLETCGIVADYDAATGELTCHVSTQMPHLARAALAEALALPVSHVRVICPAMGGAFGGKEVILPEYLCTAVAAIRLQRPVRWVEDRSEALAAGAHGKRPTPNSRPLSTATAVYGRCALDSCRTLVRTRAESARTSSSWSPRTRCPGSTASTRTRSTPAESSATRRRCRRSAASG